MNRKPHLIPVSTEGQRTEVILGAVRLTPISFPVSCSAVNPAGPVQPSAVHGMGGPVETELPQQHQTLIRCEHLTEQVHGAEKKNIPGKKGSPGTRVLWNEWLNHPKLIASVVEKMDFGHALDFHYPL